MKGTGNVILMIGQRDAGKTTKTKELLAKSRKPKFVFDFRSEYGYSLPSFEDFMSSAIQLWNHNIVIEECTVFLGRKTDNPHVRNLLAGASHRSNNIYMLYHSLRSIPDQIFELTNYYYLFHTLDNEGVVRKLFRYEPEMIQDFEIVKKNRNAHFYTVRKRS